MLTTDQPEVLPDEAAPPPRIGIETSKRGPVFITGTSRSGTTLMAQCLRQHADIWIAPETHYFDDLRLRMAGRESSPLSDDDRRLCEDYFEGILRGLYGTAQSASLLQREREEGADQRDMVRNFSREELRAFADNSGEGADAYFEGFCRYVAAGNGRTVWGEKTPRHAFCLPTLLERYPEANVIHMVRDPRAVTASYRRFHAVRSRVGGTDARSEHGDTDAKRVQRSYHPAIQAMLWKSAYAKAGEARDRFGEDRVLLVRYEDFVAEGQACLERIAVWLGLDEAAFDLTDLSVVNSSHAANKSRAGISSDSVERWRDDLPASEIALVQQVCRGTLRRAGYDLSRAGASPFAVAAAWCELPIRVASALKANRARIVNPIRYVRERIT